MGGLLLEKFEEIGCIISIRFIKAKCWEHEGLEVVKTAEVELVKRSKGFELVVVVVMW